MSVSHETWTRRMQKGGSMSMSVRHLKLARGTTSTVVQDKLDNSCMADEATE